eukprot:1159649-Pelagomonas_calceolata.AAC.2
MPGPELDTDASGYRLCLVPSSILMTGSSAGTGSQLWRKYTVSYVHPMMRTHITPIQPLPDPTYLPSTG